MAASFVDQMVKLDKSIREQRAWMERCGGTRQGYIEKYGSKDAAEHYGDGGELIYAADRAELDELLSRRELLIEKRKGS